MSGVWRWFAAGLLAVGCAVAGVFVASLVQPRDQATPQAKPVIVAVTTTATARPSASPAPVVSAPGLNLSEHSIDDPTSVWVVVNKLRPLDPLEFSPDDLTNLSVPGGGQLTSEAAKALTKMYAAARDDGAGFGASTAYRSYNFQKGLFAQYVASDGVTKAETFSARAGFSEHQTGLALDIYDLSAGCGLKKCFADTKAGKWLVKHAADYGFIERYQDGQTDITGYKWEPWHWRYVGVDLAQYMRDQDIATLEEVFDLPAAPDYD
ncbi:D-alanyl-D-alanine carboxypeptidase family protein [Demequina sp.]|uniref:M15 family metallopeptidase n=1 Tax=Demequina sp. TaxID=2050685 RepID=UPI003D12A346